MIGMARPGACSIVGRCFIMVKSSVSVAGPRGAESCLMSSVTKVRCPGCRNLLRIPTDWLARPIRCKHCAKSFRPGAEERAGVDNPFAFSEPDGDANLHTIPVNAGLHARGHRSSIMQWVVLA